MSNITADSLELIRRGVDLMCDGTREGFPLGLSGIVGLVPDQEDLISQYESIVASAPDQRAYIDQATMRIGAHACLELSVAEGDSTPLGVYLERFHLNRKYGNMPRQLAKIVVSTELQNARAIHDFVRGDAIYKIGDSTRLLLPSDRIFVTAGNAGRALVAKLRSAK